MAIERSRDRLSAEELDELGEGWRGAGELRSRLRLRAAGIAFLAAGAVVMAVMAFVTPGMTVTGLVAALVLLVVVAIVGVSLLKDVVLLRAAGTATRQRRALLEEGVAELLRLRVDRAWRAESPEPDGAALLLRSGDAFVYLDSGVEELLGEGGGGPPPDGEPARELDRSLERGSGSDSGPRPRPAPGPTEARAPWLNDANGPMDAASRREREEPARRPRRIQRINAVRRLPEPDGHVLELIVDERAELPLEELPRVPDDDAAFDAILARAWCACAVLALEELPEVWREVVFDDRRVPPRSTRGG
ncbi:MAG TPA: hypothetical protein PKC43_10620 [Phycisphaerales bacterium]|nr:hypothetical protein [Phycisphaerales bacterium]HMP37888.1 hypothetical protein [Phycisphaerales bacterium]